MTGMRTRAYEGRGVSENEKSERRKTTNLKVLLQAQTTLLDEALAVRRHEAFAGEVERPRSDISLPQPSVQRRKLAIPSRDDPSAAERPIRSELMNLNEVKLEALPIRLLSDRRARDADRRPPRNELVLAFLRLVLALLKRQSPHLPPQ